METILQDIRYVIRSFLKTPSFTIVVLLVLALGIGANTAVFSVVKAAILKPLPYPNVERLLIANGIPLSLYFHWKAGNKSLDLEAHSGREFNVSGGPGQPESVIGSYVSRGYLSLLGLKPIIGRLLSEEEFEQGREKVALIGYSLWRRRFGEDPSVIGRSVTLNGTSYTVVGVLPAFSQFSLDSRRPRDTELWVPLLFSPPNFEPSGDGQYFVGPVARLRPGVTMESARAEYELIGEQFRSQNTSIIRSPKWKLGMSPLYEQVVSNFRPTLLMLLAAVGIVALIGCANVANLLLARGMLRQREIALRSALGAGRQRLIRQLLTENLAIAIAGGVSGVFLAKWILAGIASFIPANLPGAHAIGVDWSVLGFTLLLSVLTAFVFGFAPAWITSKQNLVATLREGARGVGGSKRRSYVFRALVGLQVALALILTVGAGLMVNSLIRLQRVESGFEPNNVVSARIQLPRPKYSMRNQTQAFYDRALESVRTLPGVEDVATVNDLPLSGEVARRGIDFEDGRRSGVDWDIVSPGYFQLMRIPMMKGRDFADTDKIGSPEVAIVNEKWANQFYPHEDPIGKKFRVQPSTMNPWLTVVGVVKDVRRIGLDKEITPCIYVPYRQVLESYGTKTDRWRILVRSNTPPANQSAAIGRMIANLDTDQSISEVRLLNEVVSDSVAHPRFRSILLSAFSGLALLLAVAGVYGMMAHSVSRRVREFGVRMALGADRQDIIKLTLKEGMITAGVGSILGLVGVLALTRVVSGFLYGVQPTDPVTLVGVTLLMLLVTLLASYIPARRAAKVDPLVVLRDE